MLSLSRVSRSVESSSVSTNFVHLIETPPKSSDNFDPLSDLPDAIFHHVLSYLDIKHVARVSTLSKRCRNVCLSSPFLTIILRKISHNDRLYRFSQFLHRFMSLRNGVGMCQFNLALHWQNPDDDEFHIGNWLLEATMCNVENICLHLHEIKLFTLPSGVLNCASLRYLEVNLAPNGFLKFPATPFVGLKNLKLKNMFVSIEYFGEWISSCQSLKALYLGYVRGVHELNISSSSLVKLTLEDMGHHNNTDSFSIKVSAEILRYLTILWNHKRRPKHSLTLHAPKLKQFAWDGYVTHYSYKGIFESLRYFDISIFTFPISNNEDRALANEIIGKVLQTIYRVSWIRIFSCSIKEIFSPVMLPEFCNLRSLTIMRHLWANDIPSSISFLNSIPHLDTLKIYMLQQPANSPSLLEEEEKICYTAEHWESKNLKFVNSLKEVEMEISGEENEIQLIKYLLKNAESLKKMTILYPTELCKQSVISRKIQQFQIASSSIALYFLQS